MTISTLLDMGNPLQSELSDQKALYPISSSLNLKLCLTSAREEY